MAEIYPVCRTFCNPTRGVSTSLPKTPLEMRASKRSLLLGYSRNHDSALEVHRDRPSGDLGGCCVWFAFGRVAECRSRRDEGDAAGHDCSCAGGIPSTLRIANDGALLGRSGPLRFQRFGTTDSVPEPPGSWGVKWSVVVVGSHTLELRSYQPSVGFVFGSAPATWQVPAGRFIPIRRLVLEPCASSAATVFVGGLSYLHRPACARFVIIDDATGRTWNAKVPLLAPVCPTEGNP